MTIVGKSLQGFQRVQVQLLGWIMMTMTFGYSLNVLVREVAPDYAADLVWIEELCLYGMVWLVFLGLSVALESGRHIGMRMLLTRMPAHAARAAKMIVNFAGLLFSAYLAKIGYEITVFVAMSGQVSPTLGVSTAWLYWTLPVGFTLVAARYLYELLGFEDRFAREIDPLHLV